MSAEILRNILANLPRGEEGTVGRACKSLFIVDLLLFAMHSNSCWDARLERRKHHQEMAGAPLRHRPVRRRYRALYYGRGQPRVSAPARGVIGHPDWYE